MNMNELKEIVVKNAEMVETNAKIVAELDDYVADSAKKVPYNGTITINKSLCLVMTFDTITVDAIDNFGFDMPSSRRYIHFCNSTNELQIPIEEIFQVFLTDEYAVDVLRIVLTLIGAGLGGWGIVNLLEAYGSDNAGGKSQGMKQFMAN